MKARGAAVQGALAAVGLVAAYLTWQRSPELAKGEVMVMDLSRGSLEKVRFQDGPAWLELWREQDALWLQQGRDAVPQAPQVGDGGLLDAGVAMPAAATSALAAKPPKTVRANDRAEKALERFTPLRAARGFGALAPEKLKELGLEGSSRVLEVFAQGSKRSFTLAQASASPFARDEKDGQVYLLPSTVIADLDPNSQQLVDRRLHAFRAEEFEAFVVKVDGRQREFLQSGAAIPATTKVTPKDQPDKPDDFARNWHDRLWNKLLVGEVLGKGELPAGGEPKVAVRVEYLSRGSPKGFIELAPGEGKAIFARSEHTASWVVVSQGGDNLIEEAKKLVSGP